MNAPLCKNIPTSHQFPPLNCNTGVVLTVLHSIIQGTTLPLILYPQVKTRWSELREDEKEQVTQIAYKDVAEGVRDPHCSSDYCQHILTHILTSTERLILTKCVESDDYLSPPSSRSYLTAVHPSSQCAGQGGLHGRSRASWRCCSPLSCVKEGWTPSPSSYPSFWETPMEMHCRSGSLLPPPSHLPHSIYSSSPSSLSSF